MKDLCRTWDEAPDWARGAAAELMPVAWALKEACIGLFTEGDVGLHADALTGVLAIHGRGATAADLASCKAAAARVGEVRDEPLLAAETRSGRWVKLAYSPFLRRLGELLNFFPGRYPGGIPNAPSPFAATLTGGLVGAGLGYGLGYGAEALLPGSFERGKLRRAAAIAGGLLGAAPGAAWLYSAKRRGLSMFDGGDLAEGPVPNVPNPGPAPDDDLYKGALDALAGVATDDRHARVLAKRAAEGTGFEAAFEPRRGATPLDVNVDALGRILYDSGADRRLAGVAMGTLRAAGAMPGGERPGFVTPAQLGEFAMAAGSGYFHGAMVGAALGALTGLPRSAQTTLARTGAAAGIVGALIPSIYGN